MEGAGLTATRRWGALSVRGWGSAVVSGSTVCVKVKIVKMEGRPARSGALDGWSQGLITGVNQSDTDDAVYVGHGCYGPTPNPEMANSLTIALIFTLRRSEPLLNHSLFDCFLQSSSNLGHYGDVRHLLIPRGCRCAATSLPSNRNSICPFIPMEMCTLLLCFWSAFYCFC